MNFLEVKEKNNSVSLNCYASGDGSISFVFHSNIFKEASPLRVTSRDVDAFLERRPELKRMKKVYIGGAFKLCQPVSRVSTDELSVNGRSYRYMVAGKFDLRVFNERDEEVLNMNILGAIRFFLEHEEELSGKFD